MPRVASASTRAARARSLKVRRRPRCVKRLPKPISSTTSEEGLLSTDGERYPPITAESRCSGVGKSMP